MSSGGGKAKTPILLNDNLKSKQFLRVLDLISEGPIYGPVDTEHMSSIMLNKTPVTNKNGDISINGVAAAWRNGSEYQEPINGFDYLESTVMVNNAVTKETPLVRTITNQEVDRVRLNIGVSSLVKTDSSGNQENSSVQMAIEVKSGNGGYVTQKIVTIGPNKISGEYLESHIIEAPEQKPFDLRVRRITEDSNSDSLQNGTIWNSYTEIIDDRLSYPFSAIVGVVIDRDQFKDTPTRNYHYRGLIVDVPDNYDPINRTYNGVWLGGFKQAWTNNPAWLYRALIKNNRYGLAKRVGFVDIDDGRLYALSQFCDQLVNDGYGGKEPRFTLNAYLTSQEKAKVILDKIASSLRGSSVWDGSYFSMLIDMPSDPVALITNSNVIDGKFTRNSTPSDERYNAVIVSWVDPNNGWETSKEYVADDVSIANDGYKETTIEAFGCTSRGQAYRVGKWLLETSLRETGRISFSMARDAISFMPCDIVEIADNQHIGTRVSGRVISRNKRIITVDAPIEINEQSITFSMMGAHGKPVKFDVDYIDGNKIHLLSEPEYFKEHSPFVISAKNLKTKLYRITSVKEEEGNGKYKISAAEHNPNKQAIVDEGAVFDQPTNTINGYRAPSIERLRVISVNSPTVQTTVAWESSTVTKDLSFEVRVYSNNGNVVFEDETDLFSYNFFGLNAGNYFVGVKAKIINGMKGAESQIEMNIGAPPKPTHIQIDSMHFALKATPYISTDNSINTVFEFWGSEQRVSNVADIETKTKRLGKGSFWIKDGLKEGQEYWFYIRSINPFGVSDFVEATGKPDNVIAEVIDELGDTFLTNEGGKQMQEQIDFSKEAIAELELDAIDVKQKVVSIDRDVEAVNEAVMMNTKFTTELHFSLKEEVADRKAEIFRIEQVQVTDREAAARWQEQITAKVDYNASEILNIKDAQSSYEKATAQQISQVKADVDGVKSRVTTVETATADLKQSQAKFEQSTTAEFGEMRGYITHFETSLSNVELAVSEAIMQTTAQVNQHSSELLQSKADVKRIANATATNEKATAELAESVKAQFEESQAEFVDVRKSIAEQDKAHSERTEQVRAELGKDINSNKEELSKVSAAVTTNTKAIAKTDETVTELQQLQTAQFNDNSSSIANVQHTQANADSTSAESTLQLAVQQNQQGTELLRAKASIRETNKIIVDNDKAYAQKFTQLDSQFEQVNARFTRVESTLADAQQSITETKEQLYSEINSVDRKVTAVDQKVDQTKATLEGAIAESNQTLSAKVETAQDTANTAKSNAADAKQDIDRYKNSNDQRMLLAETQITSNKQAIANEQETRGSQINKINSELGGLNAAFEAQAKTYVDQKGNASSIFGIKNAVVVNGQYYEAQMILGAEVKNGQVVTQIGFSADTFGIFNPSSGKLEPVFFVENGQVFINEAFINQATIEKLLIGSTIKSKNWDPATKKGLMLDFENGKLIANDAEITGKIYATDGEFNGTVYVEKLKGDVSSSYVINPNSSLTIEAESYDRIIMCPCISISRPTSTRNTYSESAQLTKNGVTFVKATLGAQYDVGTSHSGHSIHAATPGVSSGIAIIKAHETATIRYSVSDDRVDLIYSPVMLMVIKK
ncbi:TipJ family phage tail tip protein [Providencia stuartii]|uniref:TipJ family phage tail tip protein n=2 Tax=Providencia stuartii TaxID=588 RepID=UPI002B26C019|nr:phage tail protein [Providencia stuartii]CAK6614957.1 Fibronectin type III domain protein [Providencia stuartii]CAK6616151.1 Fibronectin type III domain protein [Providencia stuartii]